MRATWGIPLRKGGTHMAKGSSSSKGSGGSAGKGQYHSAKTGKFVTPKYAKTHPSTTFKESSRKK